MVFKKVQLIIDGLVNCAKNYNLNGLKDSAKSVGVDRHIVHIDTVASQ